MSPLILAVISGVGFTFIGIAYRLGQDHGVPPIRVAIGFSIVAAAFFGANALGTTLSDVPARVWIIAVIVAAGQYVTVKMVRVALARGPLSPLWCACMLGFVPAVLYARLFLGEQIEWMQYAGVVAGVLCVVAGSRQQGAAGESRGAGGSRILYGFVLLLLLASNSLAFVALKDLRAHTSASGETYLAAYRDIYFVTYYALVAVMFALDMLVSRSARVPIVRWLALGLMAGGGVVIGASALAASAALLPAAVVFTASSISSILSGTAVSVLFFREKATPAFFVMVVLGVLAVALVNGQ